jgi:hypothetical protein
MKRIHIIFAITTFVLLVTVYWTGRLYTSKIKESVLQGAEKELHSIARIKTGNFKHWYNDELGDARLIASNPALISTINDWIKSKTEKSLNTVKDLLGAISVEHSYSNVSLYTADGNLIASNNVLSPKVLNDSLITKAVTRVQTVASGFYRSGGEGDVMVSFVSPVLNGQNQPGAVISLTHNLTENYFPTFEQWPGNEESGRILLVEKAGDSIRFFNHTVPVAPDKTEVTHNAWENIITSTNKNDLAKGVFMLPDMYNTPVISHISSVPDTPWFVIVTLHQNDVFSAINLKSNIFYIISGIVIILILFIIAFFHRNNQRNYFRRMYLEHEEYKTTLYSIGDGVIITDVNGRVKNLNREAEKLTGWHEGEARDQNIEEVFEIVNENTFEKVESPVKKVLEQGKIVGLANHTILISKEGKQIPIADSGAPIFDSKGSISGTVLVFSNQSQKRDYENILKEQQRQMYTLLSNLPGMAYRCKNDKNWTMEFVSKGCLLLTGYWSSDLVNNKIIAYADLILPEDRENVWEAIQKAIDNNESFQMEYRIKTKNGEEKWVWEKGRAIYDENGKVQAIEGFINDVTENKKIEQELQKSQKLFENLATNASVGIFKTDKDGQTTYVNPKWCEITGLQENEGLGMKWVKSIHPDDRDQVKDNWLKLVENPDSHTTEYRFLHSNGKVVWVQGQISPEYDEAGDILGYIGTITDITKRVRAEQKIQENNNLLNTIIENIPDTIYMKDSKGRKIVANKNDIKVCGAERFEDIEGKTDFEIFPRDIAENSWKDDQQVLKHGEPVINKTEHLVNKEGGEQWLQTSKIPLKNDIGEIIGLVGLGHDITKQVEAEKERTKLTTAITQAPLSVIITDTAGVIEYVNPYFTESTGYNYDEAVGNKPNILKSGTNTAELYSEMWSMITRGYDWRGELQNKRKDGELFWVNVVISPIKNDRGEIINYVALEEDITYKKELIEELVDAKNKAEESDLLKTSFLANMSHEIRTPLNSILGFTDLLKEAEHLSKAEQKEFSSIINKSADSLLQIINDIIDISKLETRQLKINPVQFKLNPLLDALYTEYKGFAEKSSHKIEIRLLKPGEDIVITTDKNRLNQIFVNLLNNAIKFTPEGYIEFGITRYDGQNIYFKVEDSGIGISKEFQKIIFDRFRQIESSSTRKFGGNGLGLSIVKKLIDVMGGDISLESEPGKGSCFSFYLPR